MSPQIISFKCILRNAAGRLISQTYNREVLTAIEPAQDGVLRGLNKNLQNIKKGETRKFTVRAEEAYGLYRPEKLILFPRRKLPKEVVKGEQINIVSATGVQRSYRVVEFLEEFVRLDGNHPLAGQDLIFEIETLDAREATVSDLEQSFSRVPHKLLH